MSFTPPFAPHQLRPTLHSHHPPSAVRKRKRPSPPPQDLRPWDPAFNASPLAVQASNPLSLTPSEVTQWRVAGLPLDQPHPSTSVPQFPHRRLPRSADLPKKVEVVTDEEHDFEDDVELGGRTRTRGTPHLRMQHLEVLGAILHRCLLEGDISRASRAWALLLRTESAGKPIEIKESGYWGIGAELLVRGGEQPTKGKRRLRTTMEEEEEHEGDWESQDSCDPHEGRAAAQKSRWGTTKGWDRARDYYERLILQYPYKRQYDHRTSALDFWPALIACEIYGIQQAHSQLLFSSGPRHSSTTPPRSPSPSTSQAFSEIYSAADSDDGIDARSTLRARHDSERVREERWELGEQARRAALIAASKLTARMDELMAVPPYSDSGRLLKLRGMLALYIGDLGVPGVELEAEAEGDGEGEEGWEMGLSEQNRERWERRQVDGRMRERMRRAERERGAEGRREGWEKARGYLERAAARGFDCRERIARLEMKLDRRSVDEDEEEEEDGDEEMEDIYDDD